MRLKRLYQFVANYDIDKWAQSILTDIWAARKEDSGKQVCFFFFIELRPRVG